MLKSLFRLNPYRDYRLTIWLMARLTFSRLICGLLNTKFSLMEIPALHK